MSEAPQHCPAHLLLAEFYEASGRWPAHVFFVTEYPMTGSGKVQKYKLREMSLELLRAASG